MIIGVVGTFASGKDTVAAYLVERGFSHFSTADEIRRLMRANGLPLDRDSMTAFARTQRAEHGNGYFTERTIRAFPSGNGQVVVTDMRHPDEIRALQTLPQFTLIGANLIRMAH